MVHITESISCSYKKECQLRAGYHLTFRNLELSCFNKQGRLDFVGTTNLRITVWESFQAKREESCLMRGITLDAKQPVPIVSGPWT